MSQNVSIKTVIGKVVKYHPRSAESRETGTRNYRHDKIEIDGRRLEGHVQIKVRRTHKQPSGEYATRTEVITCYRGTVVRGHDIAWLAQQNGMLDLSPAAEKMQGDTGN